MVSRGAVRIPETPVFWEETPDKTLEKYTCVAIVPTQRLEVFVSSEMGTGRWKDLRKAARGAITSVGFAPLYFEDFAPGPIDTGFDPGDLGVDTARRADMAAVIIGSTVTEPVGKEIQALMDREPRPPIGFFFDETVESDAGVRRLWDELKDRYVLSTFRTAKDLVSKVGAFLGAHSHEARQNLRAPRMLIDDDIALSPGAEARRRWLLLEGDRIVATAVAAGSQHHFHFALVDRHEFVRRTENMPYYDFGIGGDKYSFEKELTADETGIYYAVVRRPWWFHVGDVRVRLSVLLHKSI